MSGRTPGTALCSPRNSISRTNRWYGSFSTLVVFMSFNATGEGKSGRVSSSDGGIATTPKAFMERPRADRARRLGHECAFRLSDTMILSVPHERLVGCPDGPADTTGTSGVWGSPFVTPRLRACQEAEPARVAVRPGW